MQLVGIMDADIFRGRIMEYRDLLKRDLVRLPGGSGDSAGGEAQLALLRDIKTRLDEIAALLRERR
jgi:hypothetical protein